MTKRVRLGRKAFDWLRRKLFLPEQVIVDNVKFLPPNKRKYIDHNHFTVDFNRKTNKKVLKITVYVEETSTEYFVYKMHSEGLRRS